MEDPAPQVVLAGKYRLVRPLGKGGMGQVWLADHLNLHCPVAIKIIDPRIATDPDYRARFLREARAAAALRSPHVVQILDHGVDGDLPYIVMELLDGESLAQRLWRLGSLAPAETAHILTQVGRAITRAHEAGVIHRDLKPDNVFLVNNDDEEVAKVVDFGIAKSTGAEQHVPVSVSTGTGKVLGTCFYMSPEQAAGAKSIDHRTDIWSMGVMAFECILGRRPFQGDTLGGFFRALYGKPAPVPSTVGAVPTGFDEWFSRACAHDVDARFPTAREASAELRRVCGQPLVGPTSDQPPLPSTLRQQLASQIGASSGAMMASELVAREPRRMRGLSVVLAAMAVAALGFWIVGWRRQPAPPRALLPAPAATSVTSVTLPPPRVDRTTAAPPPVAAPALQPTIADTAAAPAPSTIAPARPAPSRAADDANRSSRRSPTSEYRHRVKRLAKPAVETAAPSKPPSAIPPATPPATPRIDLGL